MAPAAEPIRKARIDSHSVTRRCFQITPEANQATIWLKTSTGLEKKNGGSHTLPSPPPQGGRERTVPAATALASMSNLTSTFLINFAVHQPRHGCSKVPT